MLDAIYKLFELIFSIDGVAICLLVNIVVSLIDLAVGIKNKKIYGNVLYKRFKKTLLAPIIALLLVFPLNCFFNWPWSGLDTGSIIVVAVSCGFVAKFAYELLLFVVLKKFVAIILARFSSSIAAANSGLFNIMHNESSSAGDSNIFSSLDTVEPDTVEIDTSGNIKDK